MPFLKERLIKTTIWSDQKGLRIQISQIISVSCGRLYMVRISTESMVWQDHRTLATKWVLDRACGLIYKNQKGQSVVLVYVDDLIFIGDDFKKSSRR